MIVDTNLTHECPLGSWRDAPDDAVLLAYANGDEEAARVLSLRLVPRVLAQATRYAGRPSRSRRCGTRGHDELWEIAADWRQGEAQVSTWLYRVVANLCTDRLRKRRGVSLDQIAEPTDPQMSATAQMQETSRLTALANALAQLPDRQA
jgi:DNA-directed RNA polymerase specialized sigma24 family protein